MTWDDAMDQYGSDKPDLRFGMKLVNMNQALEGTQFKVFKDIIEKGGLVKAINVKGYSAIPRRELDGLVDFVGIYGAKGLAWHYCQRRRFHQEPDCQILQRRRNEAHPGNGQS